MRILAASSPGEIRVAMWDGTLEAYAIWRPGAPDGVGDLHRGRVIAVARGFAGCFVALDQATGFMPDSEHAGSVSVGEIITVRITRAAQGGKGPRLSARAMPVAEGPPRLIARAPGALERLAASYPDAPITLDDPALAARLHAESGGRISLVPRAFDDAVEDEIAALAEPVVSLTGGARMIIQPTSALVAIDIDAGAAMAAGATKQAGHAALNAAVVPELARQIRLRNLGGAILVDWAALTPRRRAGLGDMLRAALAQDPIECRLIGFTGLGLAEIVRRRVYPPLHDLLTGPHAAAAAALRAALAEARPGAGATLRLAPAVAAAIDQDEVMRHDLARRATHGLVLRTDPGLPGCGWRLDERVKE